MSIRKKRVVLSIEEKKQLIQIKEAHPNMKFNEVIEEFYKINKKIVSVPTAQRIWSNRENILQGHDSTTESSHSNVSISEETIKRVDEARKEEKTISESFVISIAKKVVSENKLNANHYFFSADWARNIMKGKKDDNCILKKSQSKKKESSSKNEIQTKQETPGEINIKRLTSLSTREKQSILEKPFSSDCSSTESENEKEEPVTTTTSKKSTTTETKKRTTKRKATLPSKQTTILTPIQYIQSLQTLIQSKGDQRDYKSVLYDMLEESYKSSPYVTSLKKELENVKTTLQFMVEKEGHIW